jgi:uncharacterized protein involved in response to NO
MSLSRPVLLALGFRPFFLLALLHAVVAMGAWAWLLHRDPGLLTGFPGGATGWHAREMVFGYAPAMVAGFLLTAVRNWTGRDTATGWPLAALAGLWLVGRLTAPLDSGGLVFSGAADLAFLIGLVIALARPVVAAGQLRQQSGVLAKVALLGASHGLWLTGALGGIPALQQAGLIAGLLLVIALMLVVVQRVLVFFSRRALGTGYAPADHPRLDGLLLALMVAYWLLATLSFRGEATAVVAGALALLHALRWGRWFRPGILAHPLLAVLYAGYAWIIAGLALHAAGIALGWPLSPALHAFGAGAIATMTAGMMVRVTLGHTGRDVLAPPRWPTVVFVLISLAALVRVLAPLMAMGLWGPAMALAQGLWLVAFVLLLAGLAPMLLRPRVDGAPL